MLQPRPHLVPRLPLSRQQIRVHVVADVASARSNRRIAMPRPMHAQRRSPSYQPDRRARSGFSTSLQPDAPAAERASTPARCQAATRGGHEQPVSAPKATPVQVGRRVNGGLIGRSHTRGDTADGQHVHLVESVADHRMRLRCCNAIRQSPPRSGAPHAAANGDVALTAAVWFALWSRAATLLSRPWPLVSTRRCWRSGAPLLEAIGETERHRSATSRPGGSTATGCSTTSHPHGHQSPASKSTGTR